MININPYFLNSGNAIFTVSNPSGEHYTYHIVDSDLRDERSSETLYFVHVLTGPNNLHDYTYLGMYDPWGFIKMTKASKYDRDSRIVKVLDWAIDVVFERKKLPDGYAIQHVGKCGRCSRRLTTPESLACGLGPVCRDAV